MTLPRCIPLHELRASDVATVGGKAANLGELMHIDGVDVPPGFVVLSDDVDVPVEPGALYAVRSSATLEDSPSASFAGQYETYLNVSASAIREHVRRCFASLTNERALAYLAAQGLDRSKARMSVVIQKMVPARISGVLFTADPMTGHRKHAKVEAVFGLGEQLVSGKVAPTAKLSAEQEARLVATGRRIEAHFGRPQDIEWCLDADDRFHIVQSRAITTLFPVPATIEDRAYLSVGHQQMMTDAMRPLGLSFYLAITPAPMLTVGGRLFVDVTKRVGPHLLGMMGRSDPLMRDALETLLERGFLTAQADPPMPPAAPPLEASESPVAKLMADAEASIAKAATEIRGKTGLALFDFIFTDLAELKRVLRNAESTRTYMSGMEATWWLNETMPQWLGDGEKNAADTLAQSVPNNVTSEMGLALLDVADAMRANPDDVTNPAFQAWLAKYGMRCVGEIDITRPRWSEHLESLLPLIHRNIELFAPGEAKRRFDAGLAAAAQKEAELLARVGEARADETKRAIDRVRAFAGYREFPKYAYICRYAIYKQALMAEAVRLVDTGVIGDVEDIFYLSLHELRDAVERNHVDDALIAERREAFAHFQTLKPPRVLTSEGECLNGSYRREAPPGALVGLPVSAGTACGRARVVFDVADAKLEPGDILVTPFTDPSWTPVFVAIKGLVTEVGGLMTHGAVIAREYGLPAIVGVENATQRIADGQRIRVHGTDGYVELL